MKDTNYHSFVHTSCYLEQIIQISHSTRGKKGEKQTLVFVCTRSVFSRGVTELCEGLKKKQQQRKKTQDVVKTITKIKAFSTK